MDLATWHHRVIAGAPTNSNMPVRAVLRAAAGVYAAAIEARNAHYDRNGPRAVMPVPVISVGNLTVGGTGKTPLVIELLGRLRKLGCTPAVISRGYKAGDEGVNEEQHLIRRHVRDAICFSFAKRAEAAELAIHKRGADVIVLDDAFQHRQLGRTLDIVLVDATCPFGFDHLIPRGLLREPVASLRRSHVIVLTRCDQVSTEALAQVEMRLRSVNTAAKIIKSTHRVTGLQTLDGSPVHESAAGKRALLFAGIGRPQAFLETARGLGVEVVAKRWWPDHHPYVPNDLDQLTDPSRFPPHDWLMTTEKDAVKLVQLPDARSARIVVLGVAIDFEDDGGTILQFMLDGVIRKS